MQSDDQRKVSVIMVSCRRPHLIGQSIRSILAQTHKPFEIIVVDNRSERSEEVKKVLEEFPEVRLISNPRNLGFSRAVNVGLKSASGDFIYLTEDDLVWDSRSVEKLLEFHLAQPGPKLLGGVLIQWEDGHPIEESFPLFFGGEILVGKSITMNQFDRGHRPTAPIPSPFLPGGMIFGCAEAFRLLGGFRDDFFLYEEDVELCLRASRLGISRFLVPEAVTYHKAPISWGKAPGIHFSKLKNNFTVNLLYLPRERILRFIGSCVFQSVRRIDSSTTMLAVLRFWVWIILNLPRLLIERFGAAKQRA